MATRKQIRANRRNAQLSTGPKSPEALATLHNRARTHSLTGAHIVLPYERPEDYDALRDDLFHDYAPASTQECILVDGIAQQHWKLQRANRLEVAQLNIEFEVAMHVMKPAPGQPQTAVDPDRALAMAICQDPIQLLLLHRYTITIERSLQRFIHDLHIMQKERRRQEQLPAPSQQSPNPEIGFEMSAAESAPPSPGRFREENGKWIKIDDATAPPLTPPSPSVSHSAQPAAPRA